ncbi:hypothetical protein FP435_01435 [Lactobacillus sp. PV037]|uniref:hypothetical protein n=1 Tax=unclassified Lactobacillus TaxID=2620435 RepID=UPI00223EBCD2|nr:MULTISPECIES: hypothetical protein [unclassified Lactobacillus]QNQ82693.1 hypothetical protein FP433_06375 [Lactobacillus sp. PV012]QNQ83188.1 hypothetical protein FP435_01435 [Lactobacillus sp. PV037]
MMLKKVKIELAIALILTVISLLNYPDTRLEMYIMGTIYIVMAIFYVLAIGDAVAEKFNLTVDSKSCNK